MRKQTSKNSDWLKLYDECLSLVSVARLRELENDAIQRAKAICKQEEGHIAYGWSGGKDSVALAHVMSVAGLDDIPCFCSLYACEYPAMEQWLLSNAPKNTEFVRSERYDLAFVKAHPDWLFPRVADKKIRGAYTAAWRPQEEIFCKKHNISAVIAGRRIEDGNYCGRREEFGYVTRGKTLASYNLMAEWSHAEVLAYMRRNNLPFAPCYSWPNGYVYGTHGWIERDRAGDSIDSTFDEIWEIDKSIIYQAAKELDAAREYLMRRNQHET